MRYKLLLLATTLIWGSSFVIVKDVTGTVSPTWLVFMRFATAAAVLAIVFIGRRRLFLDRAHMVHGILVGLAIFVGYYFQTIGITDTTPGKNAFLTGVYCAIVPFLAWAVARKRPNRFNIVAAFLCVAGIGFISLEGDLTVRWGDAMTLIGACGFAMQIVLVAKYSEGKDVFVFTMWQFATVGACALAVAAFTEAPPSFAGFEAADWASLVYLTLVVTLMSFVMQNIGQKHVTPSTAGLILSLESVFGALFSILLGAEVLSLKVGIGFALVFIALVTSEYLPDRLALSKKKNSES